MLYTNTKWKIALGYIVLIFATVFSGWLLYINIQSQQNIKKASTAFAHRQDAADKITYAMLDVNNAERAVCLGQTEEWQHYERAIKAAQQATTELRHTVKDNNQLLRIDSLQLLLSIKYKNMQLIMSEILHNNPDTYYYKKVKDLYSGRDSVIVQPKTTDTREDKHTVYEVAKTKKGFFARLADAFRKQHNDTISVRHEATHLSSDTVKHSIDLADTLADVLTAIKQEENKAKRARQESINQRGRSLQMTSMQLARRTQLLLEDIQNNEQQQLQQAIDNDFKIRQEALYKVEILAALAILSALVLLLYIYRDIQRQQTYRKHLEQAKEETERVMEQRERLLLTITHDIKAPVASISGFIELLDEQVTDEKAKNYLNNIRSSASHLLHLVRALLDYHQLKDGKAQLHTNNFNPAKLVESCITERFPQAHDKGLQLICNTNGCRQQTCKADDFRIKQILDNLISNAIKYTHQGSVNVTAKTTDSQLLLTVSDTGIGMTHEETQRIFDTFTRLPEAQGTDGVGLGLSITQEVVNMLNGKIQLHSKKGYGSTFTVCIPIELCSNNKTEDLPTTGKTKPKPKFNQPYKVLIIDDDSLQIQLLREMFSRITSERWNVITCQHISEALHTIKIWHPQIMLADIEMPEMNGTELIKQIDHSKMVVIGMTAHEQDIKSELLNIGFDACLFKPFNIYDLTQLLKDITGTDIKYSQMSQEQKPQQDIFFSLISFAEGDKQAEHDILLNFKQSIQEYIYTLTSFADKEHTASVAHKLLPIASMLNLKTLQIIQKLIPENINMLGEDAISSYQQQIIKELRNIEKELENRIKG